MTAGERALVAASAAEFSSRPIRLLWSSTVGGGSPPSGRLDMIHRVRTASAPDLIKVSPMAEHFDVAGLLPWKFTESRGPNPAAAAAKKEVAG